MSNSRPLVAVAGLSIVLAAVLAAAPPTAPQLNVTTTIADVGPGDPGVAFRLRSDLQGAYVTKSVGKTVTVKSVIDSFFNGSDWSLTTYYLSKGNYVASNRKVFVDLSEQLTVGGFATPVLGDGQLTAHLIVKCSQVNVDFVGMSLGSTALCPGSVRFLAQDSNWYRLAFNPDNYPEVNPFAVTCTAADRTGCKVWTIAPSGDVLTLTDPNRKSLNRLLLIDANSAVLDEGGSYYTSFSITVAR